jgi:hypothetical protein
MKKSNNNKGQIITSATSDPLNLDPGTKAKLQSVASQLDRSHSEVIEEFIRSVDNLFSWKKINGERAPKENLAFEFDFKPTPASPTSDCRKYKSP